MDSVEELREALFELSQQRDRDLAKLAQSRAVLSGLEKVTAATSPAEALDALLTSVRSSTECDAAVLLECVDARCSAIASTDPSIIDCHTVDAAFISKRSLRIVDLTAVEKQVGALAASGTYLSMMSAPVDTGTDEALVLVCLSRTRAKFESVDLAIAEQLLSLAAQTLAAKKMSDQNALLAAVLNRSSASFSIADANDPECRLIYVNKAFEELTGYSAAEAIGNNCRFLSAEDPDATVRKNIRETIKARKVGQFEVRNTRKSGEEFWNNLSIFPVDAGDSSYIVATQWDLTARVEAEADRDLARQQLVSALSGVKEGILLLDAEDRVVFVNERYCMYHSLRVNKIAPGVDFVKVWNDAMLDRGQTGVQAQASAAAALADLKTPCVQREAVLPNGFQVLLTNAQTSVGGTVSVLSDVTALKVAQQQLSERVAAIDSVQDGIAITDASGRFIYLNPSHIHMFGYSRPSEVIGRKWYSLYHPLQASFMEDVAIPEVMKSGQWRGDVLGRCKDGKPVSHEVTLTQLEGAGLICVTRDIADRVQNETERTTLLDQLHAAQRQEAIGQMAAGLAHDFNNFLSVMSGSAALVLDAGSDKERDQHAQRIIDASANAAELTQRLLQFGARKSERKAIDVRDPITSALNLVRSSIRSEIELSSDLPRQPVVCDADSTDVLQVLINLIINARDAIALGAGKIRVGLEEISGARLEGRVIMGDIDPSRDYAVVHVEDDGHGIEADKISTLFDAYVTTKSDQGGTGLGLSVVKSLVQANDGGIEIRSEVKAGTRFSIYWPVETQATRGTLENTESNDVDLQGVKVVVVDDDPQVAETIATFLEKAKCEVVICDDPREAIFVVEDDPSYWDVIVTDYDMPEMNGAELAAEIRQTVAKMPIILVTALPSYMGGERTGAKLFDARLSKPIDAKRLISEIGRAIGK